MSRQSRVVVRPTSMGFLNQGKQFSDFFPNEDPETTGVTGVVSREVKRD